MLNAECLVLKALTEAAPQGILATNACRWDGETMRQSTVAALIALVVLTLACGGSSRTPTTPAPTTAARGAQYLNSILAIMEQNSVNRETIDWSAFRAQVLAAAPDPQTIPDTFPAIRVALGLLNDHHSFYIKAGGKSSILNPSSPTGCRIPDVPDPSVPTDIGYVRIPAFGEATGGEQLAAMIQDEVRREDKNEIAGWIVDLRGNGGGNMYPMLAGVGPVLGAGTAGYFISPSRTTPFGYDARGAFVGNVVQTSVASEYKLRRPNPRVAVLTDKQVASAGEAIVVAFRERPHTRSFGTETCGVPSGNALFMLSDTAQLYLTVSRDADRTRHVYDGPIVPDETIGGSSAVVARAIAWLRAGS